MNQWWIRIRRFVTDEEGASMLEYGLMVALVALAAIVAVAAFGSAVADLFVVQIP